MSNEGENKLNGKRKPKPWTRAEERRAEELYKTMSAREVAKRLGRTKQSVEALNGGTGMTKKAELAEWKSILRNQVYDELRSRAWCRAALLRIYANQEADEQLIADTTKRNGIGFTPADAPILTSLAKQMLERNWLSAKQWEILYKLLPKYARQLQRGVE